MLDTQDTSKGKYRHATNDFLFIFTGCLETPDPSRRAKVNKVNKRIIRIEEKYIHTKNVGKPVQGRIKLTPRSLVFCVD